MTAARKKPRPEQAPLPLTIQEGVHLNLPESLYFEAMALGSSDFHILATDAPSWWFASPFNPERRERRKKSRPLAFGSALHALILEGEQAYANRFVVEPDSASSSYARDRMGMIKLLEEAGEKLTNQQSFDPAYLIRKIRERGLAHRVWDTAYADYKAAERMGLTMITADEDRRLRRMAHLVASHEDLGPNLKQGLSEVSVFWRREDRPDVLLRARFDKLLPHAVIDLKTFSNTRDESPEEATFSAIAEQGYDLQAEHYREAREVFARFVKEGRVHAWAQNGAEIGRVSVLKREKDLLEAIAAHTDWRWVWIFYQVQNDDVGKERAPEVVAWWSWPSKEPWKSAVFDPARAVIDRALTNYTEWAGRHGLARPWAEVRPIRPLPVDRLKRLSFKRTMP